MFIETRKPFIGCRIYGPYMDKKEGRRIVSLTFPDGSRSSTSYARYLLSVKLGRVLVKGEEADHIDDNKLNDSVDNIQLLMGKDNIKKSKLRTVVNLLCPTCGKSFLRDKRNTHLSKKKFKYTACSRHCSGVLGAAMQYGTVSPEIRERLLKNVISIQKIKGG